MSRNRYATYILVCSLVQWQGNSLRTMCDLLTQNVTYMMHVYCVGVCTLVASFCQSLNHDDGHPICRISVLSALLRVMLL